MNKEIKTYKTDHPIIKEISIGDRFITEDGTIVTFDKYDDGDQTFLISKVWYSIKLNPILGIIADLTPFEFNRFNIKYKLPPLKDKLDLL